MGERLNRIMALLDVAIVEVVRNPLSLALSDLPATIEGECQQLSPVLQSNAFPGPSSSASNETEAMVWQIRRRAGRLQHLMQAASAFYSSYFGSHDSTLPSSDATLAYGMHADWGGMAVSSHLSMDC